jgi:hypothetical protein
MTQTSTPKSVEEIVTKIMKVGKAIELFQTMAIMNLNMGNVTFEVNILKNKLVTRRRRRYGYRRNWLRRENSRRGIRIMWKFGRRIRQRLSRKIKYSLRNYMMRMRSSRVAQHG